MGNTQPGLNWLSEGRPPGAYGSGPGRKLTGKKGTRKVIKGKRGSKTSSRKHCTTDAGMGREGKSSTGTLGGDVKRGQSGPPYYGLYDFETAKRHFELSPAGRGRPGEGKTKGEDGPKA